MYKRFFIPPKQSYFLFGPRGTGKSTWLKTHYPNAYYIDLNDPEAFRLYTSAPEKLYQILTNRSELEVIIDEVQKVPEILNVVHKLIEEKKGLTFIMTGSSARKLKRHGVNLLGGRALLKHMPPFFAKEIKDIFELKNNILLGMLPIVLDSFAPEEVLKAYVGIYLKEEVQAEGIVRNVGDFARFLEVMSFSHGSVVNASNISREAQIARKTVDSYLIILEDLLLAFHLNVFRKKAKRSLISHSKFYFFDSGVYYSLRPKNFYDKQTEIEGAALEGMVAQHLKAWADAQLQKYQLHFWRTHSKVEVDFILSGPNCFIAIEVKNGTVIHPQDFKGLEIFMENYPEAKPILLYRGKHKYVERNILCYPVEEFLLLIDPKGNFWENL
ncbi:MAG: ATP-binding protein [Parachlamydiales bacterium]|nr:ATP-binding protein [Parachlamydiales bacterium]